MSQMRPSRVLKKIRAGQIAKCIKINLADPRVVEMAARSGFDCVWLDMEHVPNSIHDIENQIRAAKMHDVDSVVRVRRGSYSDHTLPLEMDAAGIMVPHLMSLADAKELVYHTRFHPIGRRGIDGGNSDGDYCRIPLHDYIKEANEQRFIVIQVEDPEVVDDLEKIVKLPGIDMVLFGAGDFSQAIGDPGNLDNPEIQRIYKYIPEVTRKHGKFCGALANSTNYDKLVGLGYQFLSIGADVVGLSQYFQGLLSSEDDNSGQSVYGDKS